MPAASSPCGYVFLCSLSLFQETLRSGGGEVFQKDLEQASKQTRPCPCLLSPSQEVGLEQPCRLYSEGRWAMEKPPPSACCRQSKGDFVS